MDVNHCPICQARSDARADYKTMAGVKSLTKREKELLIYILDGCSNFELAEKAGIATATAKTHRHHIYKKMKVDSLMTLMKLFDIGPRSPLLHSLLAPTQA